MEHGPPDGGTPGDLPAPEPGRGRSDRAVTCVACGERVPRTAAREYDKYGDRWTREGKRFEYLCKPCFGDLCGQPRDGLESRLIRAGAGRVSDAAFLRNVQTLVESDDEDGERRRYS